MASAKTCVSCPSCKPQHVRYTSLNRVPTTSQFSCRISSTALPLPRGLDVVKCSASEVRRDAPPETSTSWIQKTIELPPFKRGCHVITRNLLQQLPELGDIEVGLANFFIQHTSASLTINENASPDVPLDLNDSLDRLVPEGHHYRHLDEGLDDMPAHVKHVRDWLGSLKKARVGGSRH